MLIGLVNTALFLRAILSWFMREWDNKFMQALCTLTEPVLMPMRKLLSRFEFVRSFPIDLSFIATWLALDIIQVVLSSII